MSGGSFDIADKKEFTMQRGRKYVFINCISTKKCISHQYNVFFIDKQIRFSLVLLINIIPVLY